MNKLQLKLIDRKGRTKCESEIGEDIFLVYKGKYQKGDTIHLICDSPSVFCEVQLEDTMRTAVVYLTEKTGKFIIPFGGGRISYSPRSFAGKRHLITARVVTSEEVSMRRNLAFNPYDIHECSGMYPHVSANSETRGSAMFAARNAIDGIYSVTNTAFIPIKVGASTAIPSQR